MLDTPALHEDTSCNIVFTLVVENIGVKYSNRQDTEHLGNSLKFWYSVTTDWTGSTFVAHPEVGLHKQDMRYVYDQLWPGGSPQVPAQGTRKSTGRPPTAGADQNMAKQINMQNSRTPPCSFSPNKSPRPRKLSAPSCTIDLSLTPLW